MPPSSSNVFKRISNYARALWAMPHVLHDVSVRLTTLEQRTKQLSEKLKDHDRRHQNRTAKTSKTQVEHTKALAEAIATVNQAVSRTNRVLAAHPPKTQAKAVSDLTTTLRSMKKAQTRDRTHRADLDKRHGKWTKLIRGQVSAVVRRLYMPDEVFSDVRTLNANRFQLHSQHEEDGILTALFQRAGVTSRRFVEIGCGRSGGNAAMFVKGTRVDRTHARRERIVHQATALIVRASTGHGLRVRQSNARDGQRHPYRAWF